MMSRIVILCLLALVGQNGVSSKGKIRRFPKKFEFGASTSAYQIEGGWNKDGKGISIWDVATHQSPSPIQDGGTGDVSSHSYQRYKRDVDTMAELSLNFYKFSISWTRILPHGFADRVNQAGVDYYNNLINEMLKRNIKPFVTMYHYDLPANIQTLGGWTNPHIVKWFVDYANVLFERIDDRVLNWITINGPKEICYEGYGLDLKAPMLNMTGIAEYMCSKNVLLAHAGAYRLYDEKFRKHRNGTIGIAIGCTWYEPASESKDDQQAAKDARQFDWGQYAHPIFSKSGDYPVELKRNVNFKSAEQGYPSSRLPTLSAKEVSQIRGTYDFLGINHYTSKLTYRDASLEGMYAVPSYLEDLGAVLIKDAAAPQAASSWLQDVPWGFTKLLKEVKSLYDNPPVYITENGWSTSGGLLDEDRISYVRNYLNALLDALEEDCDVRGYSIWSLMDSFEWENGYSVKFGLYEVDFSRFERPRTARKSAFIYREIIRSKKLDPDYEPEKFIAERAQSQESGNDDVF